MRQASIFVLRIRDRRELVDVQTLIAQPPVKRLDEGVFHGFPGPNEIQLHAALIGPVFERARHELGAVIDGDRPRRGAPRRARDRGRGRPSRPTSWRPLLGSDSGDSTDRRRSARETAVHRPAHRGRSPCSSARSGRPAPAPARDAARCACVGGRASAAAGRRGDTAAAPASYSRGHPSRRSSTQMRVKPNRGRAWANSRMRDRRAA